MNILYSFNKRGAEAAFWAREIAAASDARFRFIPFNHDPFLDPNRYTRAQALDNLYFAQEPGLVRMYRAFEEALATHAVDAVIVDNYPPYHPDYLRRLPIYKVLRVADGPICAYDRDFAYLHAYDHVLYHSPAYSADMGMSEKLRYCGAKTIDFWPQAVFDAAFDSAKDLATLERQPRDIDVLFIGALHVGKMPFLSRIKKALGSRCRMYGLSTLKRNVYFNLRFGFPGWVRPVQFSEYVPLYQRTKIGFNVHNRGDYTVGSYRLFELPANGVMQISDGGEYLNEFFQVGEEIIGYREADDLIDKIRFYLEHDAERQRIATNGYRRVMRDHRFRDRMRQAGELIARGLVRKADRVSAVSA
jgi:glycosyltransferase involved in cell wall biosynthesis